MKENKREHDVKIENERGGRKLLCYYVESILIICARGKKVDFKLFVLG